MVRLIESIDPTAVKLKKLAIDGIQNTIKYEITCKVTYDKDKQLTAESEIGESIQSYTSHNPDIGLVLKTFGSDEITLNLSVPNDTHDIQQFVVNLLSELLDDCENIH